jgi:hypothetical protein
VLRHLENEAVAAIVRLERREDRRKLTFERDVDDCADDLRDATDEIAGLLIGCGAAAGRGCCGLLGPAAGLCFGGGGCIVLLFPSVPGRRPGSSPKTKFGAERRLGPGLRRGAGT